MLRMATVTRGANVQPIPTPPRSRPGRKLNHWEPGEATQATKPMPAAKKARPAIRMYLPPIRSARRPAQGATSMDVSGIGAIARPAFRAA